MISGSGAAPAAGLLEREAQRAHFARRAEAARAGAGSVLVLEGPAGIGKTALLRDLVREARGLGMPVVTARGGELERDHAFGAALQWVEGALRGLDGEERAAALAGAAALVGELVEGGSAPPAPAAGTGFPLMHGLYWLAANLAERRPMLLALDDAHWADEPTLRFVAFLARRVAELPVLVLLSARPDESPPTLAALADDPDVEALPLAPLGAAAGAAPRRRAGAATRPRLRRGLPARDRRQPPAAA
jgi:predicted ATPase